MILYPAIDLMGGRCVRLRQGQFDSASVYAEPPERVAQAYAKAGAEWIHVVDLDGARRGGSTQMEALRAIHRASSLKIQVGGGIRDLGGARSWLDAGAERVVLGSLAVLDAPAAEKIVAALGPERVTLAVDTRRSTHGERVVVVQGWQEEGGTSLLRLMDRYVERGIRHVLCTDVERDGMLEGANVSLYRTLQARFPSVEIQASGGIASLEDLEALRGVGARAAIVGKALYEGRLALGEALERCRRAEAVC